MKNKIIILLSFLLFSIMLQAQTDIRVYIQVADSFTGELIEDGKCELLQTDSTFIQNGEWVYNTENGVRTASFAMFTVPCNGDYIVRLSHLQYDTLYIPVNIKAAKKATYVSLGEAAYMRKISNIKLDDVVIKSTKIKMVMRGDTVVYNADAFQMSRGSMLDALIEQLPGVQLKDNGVITYNGRPISSLLVNGKDFFRGDPRIALDNLPSYMVN